MNSYFLLTLFGISVAAAGVTSLVDYDVNVRFDGIIRCGSCPGDSLAEIAASSGIDRGSERSLFDSRIVGIAYVPMNRTLDLRQNYAWGRHVAVESGNPSENLEITIRVSQCGQQHFRFALKSLPFADGEFVLHLGEVVFDCHKVTAR